MALYHQLCNTVLVQLLLKKLQSENNKYIASKQCCDCMKICEDYITNFEINFYRTYLETRISKVFWIMLK